MNREELEKAFISATDKEEKWRIYQLLADLQHKQEEEMIKALYKGDK